MATRNPLKDKVAIVGVGRTAIGRDLKRTRIDLGLEAGARAIRDAGLGKDDIDGVIGSGEGLLGHFGVLDGNHLAMQEGLGIGPITYCLNSRNGNSLILAAHAIFSGDADAVLVVRTKGRNPGMSQSAAKDPLRTRSFAEMARSSDDLAERWMHTTEIYGAWMSRYMKDYGAPREVFGLIAINNRTNASFDETAPLRTPITMDDYLNARQIYEPMCILDMDYPVDFGEALVLTTAERAKDLPHKPVYIHAESMGQTASGGERYENATSYLDLAPWAAMRSMWPKSDLTLDDMDIFFPYDGFTVMAVCFTEAAGFCKPGEGYDFLKQHWIEKEQRIKVNNKTYFSTNGGSLSHGRGGGFGYYVDSALQLRGEAGGHQVPNAKTALIGIGSFYHDPTAVILRAD